MTLRPWKRLKQYQQYCGLLNRRIAQLVEIENIHKEQVALLLKQTCELGRENVKLSQEPPKVKMPLPTVEAVEGLCAAFFDAESVIIAREALDLTRNLAPVGPQDVKATNLCLMKLWRFYAMRKVEQAAKSDAL
jgi:hypothetical protein